VKGRGVEQDFGGKGYDSTSGFAEQLRQLGIKFLRPLQFLQREM
jgi:hypothetical protein